MDGITQLNEYVEVDEEQKSAIASIRPAIKEIRIKSERMLCDAKHSRAENLEMLDEADYDMDFLEDRIVMSKIPGYADEPSEPLEKVCPKCNRKYPSSENFCMDCLVSLKKITDKTDIRAISTSPELDYARKNASDNIITDENITLINDFNFTYDDFTEVIRSIKAQSFKNMDRLIKENSIILDSLDVLDKVLLFAKSFVEVEYKSYGGELGYFEFDKIYVDDRQRKSLQITTIIHELSHFLFREILIRTVCKILDVSKNSHVESVVTYILSASVFNRLIDEYAAHSVEGRFTIFGYQDYSSFKVLQKELDPEHTDIAKTIGNTFAICIRDLLEGFIDWDLRDEIKTQFLNDTIEEPDYAELRFESCTRLSDDGFMKAIWLILTEGFADIDVDVVNSYMREFTN